eukprot:Gb_30897 [translate_table: standard]
MTISCLECRLPLISVGSRLVREGFDCWSTSPLECWETCRVLTGRLEVGLPSSLIFQVPVHRASRDHACTFRVLPDGLLISTVTCHECLATPIPYCFAFLEGPCVPLQTGRCYPPRLVIRASPPHNTLFCLSTLVSQGGGKYAREVLGVPASGEIY